MTAKKKTPAPSMMDRVSWPTVALVLVLCATIAAVWYVAPDHRGDILATLGPVGIVLAAFMRSVLLPGAPPSPPSDDDEPDDPPTPPAATGGQDGPPTRPRRATVTLRVAAPLLALLAGCSPSALRTHSTIATTARVAVLVAGDAITRTCASRLDACAADAACIETVGAQCVTAATAQTVARTTVHAYIDAIEVAAHADAGDVAEALDAALVAVARAYDSAREVAATFGVVMPALPPIALAIVRALLAEVVPGGAS